MKNWLRRNVGNLCSACLAFSLIYRIGGACLCLFGEPEFPTED